MFYFPDVLQRSTGKFSTIWMVATKGGKVTKRDYLKVNVVRTCEEIISYILVQVRPPYPSTSRPRFSLYLSAQLEIGVVRVFHRQCNYLIEEIQNILERMHRTYSQDQINMSELEQPNLLLPDMATLLEIYEGALDPFFGVMTSSPLPSPSLISQVQPLLKSPPTEFPPRGKETPAVLTVSPELITIREVEPILMPEVEAGADLPELTIHQMEDLFTEEFRFPEEPGELEPRIPRRRVRQEVPRELEVVRGVTEVLAERPEPSPIRVPKLEMEEISTQEAEVAGPPLEFSILQPGEVAPEKEVEIPAPPSLPTSPEEGLSRIQELVPSPELVLPEIPVLPLVIPRRKRRRGQLIDLTVQIPREEMQELMQTADIHCVPFRPIKLPRQQRTPPGTLFCNTTHELWTAPELRHLWSRCTSIEPVDYSARRKLEVVELEVLRETLEPSIPQLTLTGSLDESEPETSRPLIKTPEDIRPPTAEEEEMLPTVMEVSETLGVSPGRMVPPGEDNITEQCVMDLISTGFVDHDETDLHTILPDVITRIKICRLFHICLAACLLLLNSPPIPPLLLLSQHLPSFLSSLLSLPPSPSPLPPIHLAPHHPPSPTT
ncbi:REC8 meiotic recombination protein b isoform X2 [Narcine bancroftii]|uniref:REC8 meiotic recombination protein b isoform X2 n=1 Tax=Narcine bancroftii TaxID=1343680 RepID=UPI0038311588